MIRAYLFALDPSGTQAQAMRSHCGAARVAYHWCLAQVRAKGAQRAAEQTYGLTEDQLTPWINTSAYSLRKAWNATKTEVAPWWADKGKEAYATGCANLAIALGTRKLARKIDAGHARIRSATLSFQRGRWHVSFSVEVPDVEPPPRTGHRGVGIDLGISSLAVLSTGEHVPNPRGLGEAQRALRRTQRVCARRHGPARRTRAEPSNRWRKARARADRIHTRIATLRRNDTHQLTTRLVREFDIIAIEDLHVAGMLRNHPLAQRIADASWAETHRQLTDKTERAGVRLVVANRWFASSKTCSGCGTATTKLTLSQRVYACLTCGIALDRDENTARNLAALTATDTGELRREQPDRTDARPATHASPAVGPLREESLTQRHRREAVTR